MPYGTVSTETMQLLTRRGLAKAVTDVTSAEALDLDVVFEGALDESFQVLREYADDVVAAIYGFLALRHPMSDFTVVSYVPQDGDVLCLEHTAGDPVDASYLDNLVGVMAARVSERATIANLMVDGIMTSQGVARSRQSSVKLVIKSATTGQFLTGPIGGTPDRWTSDPKLAAHVRSADAELLYDLIMQFSVYKPIPVVAR